MICGNFFATFFSYSYKEYGENSSLHKPISDITLTWAASIGSGLGNGISRLSMGYLADFYTFRTLQTILTLISITISLSVFWVSEIPFLYVCCVFMNYFQLGGLFAIFPTSVIKTFGMKQGPQVYAVIIYANVFASALNIFMTRYLLPVTSF